MSSWVCDQNNLSLQNVATAHFFRCSSFPEHCLGSCLPHIWGTMAKINNSIQQSAAWKANKFSDIQHADKFYWSWRIFDVFTAAHRFFLSRARWSQSSPCHLIPRRFMLVLSFHLRLGILGAHLPSGFPTKTRHEIFFSYMPHATLIIS